MAAALQRIQAAMVDGRSRTPRYIQQQLTTLHSTLLKEASQFQEAILKDTGCSPTEAWMEIDLTVRAIRYEYDLINFKDSLQQEYSLAAGKNNVKKRVPFGCAYVVPSHHSRLYSVLQTSAAAIAAGNCVVIELQQTLSRVDRLLRETLTSVMDKDTFAIIDKSPAPDDRFFTNEVIVAIADRNQESMSTSSARVLRRPDPRVLAVVDRTADFSEAARNIVRARFAFNGKSSYAPDLILVNEFALKQFCQAAVQAFTESLDATEFQGSKVQKSQSQSQRSSQLVDTTILVSSARGRIELIKSRDKVNIGQIVDEPVLIIHPVTSLDDAIDLSNIGGSSLLALFLFGDPKAAKYLSQFIAANVSLVNHIPPQLLIGPPAPQDHALSIHARYTKEMFSSPSPEYITPPPGSEISNKLLDGSLPRAELQQLKSDIQAALPDMKQPEGKSIGFFEQGLFTGLAIEVTIATGVIALCARYAIPALLGRR